MLDVTKTEEHLFRLSEREPSKRFKQLWKLMTSEVWLWHAWRRILGNKGSQTAGVDGQIADDLDLAQIRQLAARLKDGTYRPQAVRRVYIPKANGKMRPLGIPTIEDRIVQQAMRMALEPIFEADFLDCSHGFRRHRSTHTALRDVAVAYPRTSYIVEGDIVGCFDNIPHGKLLAAVRRRVVDENVVSLIGKFLKAGYMEDWVYHKTYSGTPQGGIISPLLCNIFLHELDEMMVKQLGANRTQTPQDAAARYSKEYRRIGNRLSVVRRKLKTANRSERQQLVAELVELEKVQKRTPLYDKDRRHPCKWGYVRYADDFVILVNGSVEEAEMVKAQVADKLGSMGLKLSEEKTKLTHWSQPVRFLGFEVQGRIRDKGVQIKAIFSIPADKCEKIRQEIQQVCGCHQIPEADAMARVSLMFRGWCNYYRFASAPQKTFSRLSYFTWWQFARFLAYRHKTSVADLIRKSKRSKRLRPITIQGRRVQTFTMDVGGKELVLNIVPPKTGSIWNLPKPAIWAGDTMPSPMSSWTAGRSLETRLTAIGRTDGVCEGCGRNPVFQVHHPRPIARKSFKARVESDKAQRSSGIALCRECHAAAHGRTIRKRQESDGNAGCVETRPSGVGRAV